MLPDSPDILSAVIAAHWSGAALGLGAAAIADGLGLSLLLTRWQGPGVTVFAWLHRVILFALAIMIATGCMLIALRMDAWRQHSGDRLMINIATLYLPSKLVAKLIVMAVLVGVAALIGRFLLPFARRPERPLLPHLWGYEIVRAGLIGSASLTCWLSLITIPLAKPLHQLSLAVLIGGIVLAWLAIAIVVLLTLLTLRRVIGATARRAIAKQNRAPRPVKPLNPALAGWVRGSIPALAPLVVLAHGLFDLVTEPYGSGLFAITAALAAIVWVCCCYRVTPPAISAVSWRSVRLTRGRANLILLLAALLWGSGNVAQKTVLEHLGPFTVVGFRGLLAALVVLPIAHGELRRTRPYAATDRRLLASVAGLFALATALTQIGFAGTTVTNAGFLINTSTVLTPLLALLVYRTSPRPVVWPAVAMTLSGVWLLGGASLASLSRGDGLCLLAAAIYALWIIQMGVLVQRTGRPILAALAQFTVTAGLGFGAGFVTEPFSAANLTAALPQLLFLGVVSTGIGFLLAAIAQQHTPAADASILMSAESLFGALAATLLLGEALTPVRMLGAALLLVAIILVQLPGRKPRLAAETQSPVRRSHRAALPNPA